MLFRSSFVARTSAIQVVGAVERLVQGIADRMRKRPVESNPLGRLGLRHKRKAIVTCQKSPKRVAVCCWQTRVADKMVVVKGSVVAVSDS